MKAFYYKHPNGYTLAPIYANSKQEAEQQLAIQHDWCNASVSNCTLIRVTDQTIWEEILNG